jgi:hypothetical protein
MYKKILCGKASENRLKVIKSITWFQKRMGSYIHEANKVLNVRFTSNTDVALVVCVLKYLWQSELFLKRLECFLLGLVFLYFWVFFGNLFERILNQDLSFTIHSVKSVFW